MTPDGVHLPLAQNVTMDLRKPYETALASLFLIITMVVALVGNIAVIAGISLQHSLRSELSNILIINLSITDLSSTVFIMFSALVSIIMDYWPFGQFWCDCVCMLNYCFIIVSMLTLCCIAIDRYQAVIHPLSYEEFITKKRLMAFIVFIWLQGLAFGIAPSISRWVSYDYWEAICAIQWNLYRPDTIIYVVIAFVCCFLGPGMVLVYCYVKILKEVKKQKVHILTMQASNESNKKMHKTLTDKSKIVWSLLVVVFAYFICTAPFSVTKLIKVSVDGTNFIPGPVNLVSALLGYVACAINPLIYGIFRRDFRRAYRRLLKRVCFQKCSNAQFLNSTSTNVPRRNPPYMSDFDDVTINKTTTANTGNNSAVDLSSDSKEQRSISQISITENFKTHTLNGVLHHAIKNAQNKSTADVTLTNGELPPSTNKDQPLVNGLLQASRNTEEKPMENSVGESSKSGEPQTCTNEVHYQTIIVKSLINTNDRSKF